MAQARDCSVRHRIADPVAAALWVVSIVLAGLALWLVVAGRSVGALAAAGSLLVGSLSQLVHRARRHPHL